MTNRPIIVGFVSDLMFTTRIEAVAHHLGFRMEWISSSDQVGESNREAQLEPAGEPLYGGDGELILRLTRWQPSLLLFDLNNDTVPWYRWIATLKSSPATRRMPILCFGPHTNLETMTRAKLIGADAVLGRSRFTSDMPALLMKYARMPDHDALGAACQEQLSPRAREGIELHNRGEYFEAHEALELAWQEDQGAGRDLYQGMLQVSVTYLQIQRGNYRGALKMCLRVRQWLDPLPDVCRGVDVASLRRDVSAVQDALRSLGPEAIGEIEPALLAPIHLTTSSQE